MFLKAYHSVTDKKITSGESATSSTSRAKKYFEDEVEFRFFWSIAAKCNRVVIWSGPTNKDTLTSSNRSACTVGFISHPFALLRGIAIVDSLKCKSDHAAAPARTIAPLLVLVASSCNYNTQH